jgi:predicted RNA-binding protein Jag
MRKSYEVTAKTSLEAIASACKALGVNRYDANVEVEILEKEKEFGIDYESHKQYMKWQNQFTVKLLDYGNGWQSYLEKEMEKEKDTKRQLFIERVKEITGNIQDASFLSIGNNGEINGIAIGDKGKASVNTISAGGYNIQCFHYRVLVNEL